MKFCNTCQTTQEIDNFAFKNKSKGTRQSICRSCHSLKMKIHYSKNKSTYIAKAAKNNAKYYKEKQNLLWEYLLNHPCVDCSESDPIVLEFDHQSNKINNIANLMQESTWKIVLTEINKCEVVCANCHRRRTANTFNYWKINHGAIA